MEFNIGTRIHDLCHLYCLSEKEFCKLAGIKTSTLARYISGEKTPRLRTIEKICDALDISLTAFLDRERMLVELYEGLPPESKTKLLEKALELKAQTI